jgi:hypothetical protein
MFNNFMYISFSNTQYEGRDLRLKLQGRIYKSSNKTKLRL